jgi:hypothetical protein
MDSLLEMLQNKEKIIHTLLEDIEKCGVYEIGTTKILSSLNNFKDIDPDNLNHYLKTSFKVIKNQNSIIRKILFLLLVYAQSNQFDSAVAETLMKMGKGQEALKTMFENKLKGK